MRPKPAPNPVRPELTLALCERNVGERKRPASGGFLEGALRGFPAAYPARMAVTSSSVRRRRTMAAITRARCRPPRPCSLLPRLVGGVVSRRPRTSSRGGGTRDGSSGCAVVLCRDGGETDEGPRSGADLSRSGGLRLIGRRAGPNPRTGVCGAFPGRPLDPPQARNLDSPRSRSSAESGRTPGGTSHAVSVRADSGIGSERSTRTA